MKGSLFVFLLGNILTTVSPMLGPLPLDCPRHLSQMDFVGETSSHCFIYQRQPSPKSLAMCLYGGTLLELQNEGQQQQFTSLNGIKGLQDVWLGLNKEAGDWRWDSGFDVKWMHNRPTVRAGWFSSYTSRDCVTISLHTGQWKAENCGTPHPFICQYDKIPMPATTEKLPSVPVPNEELDSNILSYRYPHTTQEQQKTSKTSVKALNGNTATMVPTSMRSVSKTTVEIQPSTTFSAQFTTLLESSILSPTLLYTSSPKTSISSLSLLQASSKTLSPTSTSENNVLSTVSSASLPITASVSSISSLLPSSNLPSPTSTSIAAISTQILSTDNDFLSTAASSSLSTATLTSSPSSLLPSSNLPSPTSTSIAAISTQILSTDNDFLSTAASSSLSAATLTSSPSSLLPSSFTTKFAIVSTKILPSGNSFLSTSTLLSSTTSVSLPTSFTPLRSLEILSSTSTSVTSITTQNLTSDLLPMSSISSPTTSLLSLITSSTPLPSLGILSSTSLPVTSISVPKSSTQLHSSNMSSSTSSLPVILIQKSSSNFRSSASTTSSRTGLLSLSAPTTTLPSPSMLSSTFTSFTISVTSFSKSSILSPPPLSTLPVPVQVSSAVLSSSTVPSSTAVVKSAKTTSKSERIFCSETVTDMTKMPTKDEHISITELPKRMASNIGGPTPTPHIPEIVSKTLNVSGQSNDNDKSNFQNSDRVNKAEKENSSDRGVLYIIVGAVCGGVVGTAIALASVVLYRRRRRETPLHDEWKFQTNTRINPIYGVTETDKGSDV